jgi:membrane protease subunit HflK
MPWNDNSNPGPWGSGPRKDDKPEPREDGRDEAPKGPSGGPWGASGGGGRGPGGPRRPTGGPGGGGPGGRGPLKGPDLDDLFAQLGARLLRLFGGADGRGVQPAAIAAVAGVAVGVWALSGLYIVQPDEEAVVTRFGAYARSEGPGLRYHLPGPIEDVEKVSVTTLNRLGVGGGQGADVPQESLMLTSDENIVDLKFAVQWRVSNAANYLFRLSDPEATVKMTAESAMREVVGKTPLLPILTTGRGQVQSQAAELMQRILDRYGAGVTVVEVQIRDAAPPQEVVAAYRDLQTAGQDAESAVNEANTYKNRVVNEAKGDAARITQAAEAYKEQVVREAQGEADRFDSIVAEYKRAPAVTRQRLYTETMERILRRSNKVIVDAGKGGTAPIVLPPDVLRRPGAAAAPAPAAQPAPNTPPENSR